jgi:hypothetical protein
MSRACFPCREKGKERNKEISLFDRILLCVLFIQEKPLLPENRCHFFRPPVFLCNRRFYDLRQVAGYEFGKSTLCDPFLRMRALGKKDSKTDSSCSGGEEFVAEERAVD